MLAIKTETYTLLEKDPHTEAFIEYMRYKYEWGGAEVYVETEDGLTSISINTIHEIDDADLKDFIK